MRRVELKDTHLEITLSGITMLEALQGRLIVPYVNIVDVHPQLRVPDNLLRVGGTALGLVHEGHFVGANGWYFLSYEHFDRVITLDLNDFHLGRQIYHGIAIEVDDPETMCQSLNARRRSPPTG